MKKTKFSAVILLLVFMLTLSACSFQEVKQIIENKENPLPYIQSEAEKFIFWLKEALDDTWLFWGDDQLVVTATNKWEQHKNLLEVATVYEMKLSSENLERLPLVLSNNGVCFTVEKYNCQEEVEKLEDVLEWLYYRYGKGKKSENVVNAMMKFGFDRKEAELLEIYWRNEAEGEEIARLYAQMTDYTWMKTVQETASDFTLIERQPSEEEQELIKERKKQEFTSRDEKLAFDREIMLNNEALQEVTILGKNAHLYEYQYVDQTGEKAWHCLRGSVCYEGNLYTLYCWGEEEEFLKKQEELLAMMESLRFCTDEDKEILGKQAAEELEREMKKAAKEQAE